MSTGRSDSYDPPYRHRGGLVGAFGRGLAALLVSFGILFVSLRWLLPWKTNWFGHNPVVEEDVIEQRIAQLADSMYIEGTVIGEFTELIVDAVTYPPIGLSLLVMGVASLAIEYRRRR